MSSACTSSSIRCITGQPIGRVPLVITRKPIEFATNSVGERLVTLPDARPVFLEEMEEPIMVSGRSEHDLEYHGLVSRIPQRMRRQRRRHDTTTRTNDPDFRAQCELDLSLKYPEGFSGIGMQVQVGNHLSRWNQTLEDLHGAIGIGTSHEESNLVTGIELDHVGRILLRDECSGP